MAGGFSGFHGRILLCIYSVSQGGGLTASGKIGVGGAFFVKEGSKFFFGYPVLMANFVVVNTAVFDEGQRGFIVNLEDRSHIFWGEHFKH